MGLFTFGTGKVAKSQVRRKWWLKHDYGIDFGRKITDKQRSHKLFFYKFGHFFRIVSRKKRSNLR